MSEDKGRQRLGRGLASLIGGSASSAVPSRAATPFPLPGAARVEEPGERKIAVGELVANPRNPRRRFDETDLSELTASIRQHGVVQPILARKLASGRFEIVAGERRWRAAQEAGLSQVPVVVREISDRESLEIAIIENVQRADLDPIEEAMGYQMLIDEHGYTQADLADILGKSRSHVANTLRLLKLPDSVKDMVVKGELSAGAARTAVSQDDPEAFARQIVDGGLSVREAETLARGEPLAPPAPPRGGAPKRRVSTPQPSLADVRDSDTQALEKLLSDTLGLPVSIELRAEGGTMRLDFRHLDQLDHLCRLLQTRVGSESEPRVRSL
ncbi:ParB/RepB/Spo0J family partition protein [Aureimonas sp. AU40]|uniref:ParB/RepB/Spo0J family partition protein n=1 Tax=Aureimonas sp. AU40 TaxID=1637747 RepID=UPI000784E9A8|nr:ParB/RepB/Spo0J family partition protein [Aureimonas sp. AU40]